MDEQLKTLIAELEALDKQSKALLDKGDKFTDADYTAVEGIQAKQEDVKAKIEARKAQLKRITDLAAKAKGYGDYLGQPVRGGDGASTTFTHVQAGEQEADRTKSFGDFCQQIAGACVGKSRDSMERLEKVYGSGMNEWTSKASKTLLGSSGTSGGYIVPPSYYNEIMELAGEQAIIRPRATVIPMQTNEVPIPMLDQTQIMPAGQTAYFGGVVASWFGDTQATPETEPKFKDAKLIAHELGGYTEVHRNLVMDSPISMDAFLRRLFGKAIAWYEDYAFLNGNGIGKPLGIIQSDALVVTGARGSSSAISFLNATDVWVRGETGGRDNTIWLVTKTGEKALLNMTGAANQVFVPNGFATGTGTAQARLQMLLFGRPVFVTEKLPALNTKGDLMLVDPSMYLIGDRGQLEIAASEHVQFRNRRIAYLFVHRVGGMPWLPGPITLADATTTVSPFVALGPQ